jgi:proton-coupled amino acid transporter
MRMWCGISAFFTTIYIVISMKLSISNAIIFANNTGMIPELQGTLKQPAIRNMQKVLYFQFSVGLSFYYGMAIIGYWAYGSSVSEYLLHNVRGPKWEKVLANATVFVQTIISQQSLYCFHFVGWF